MHMMPKGMTGLKGSMGPIKDVHRLCNALDLEIRDLSAALRLPEETRFKSVPEKKKPDGSERKVFNPHPLIRKIQRRLVSRILSRPRAFQWPEHLYGSIPNVTNKIGVVASKDYVACAARHCGAKSILQIDIKDFFENVHPAAVLEVFEKLLGYDGLVARILARICTHKGGLPQGGIASSYLAMLSLHDVESKVVERLRLKSLVYTRYVDDITVSSKVANYDFSYARRVIEDMLVQKDLPLNNRKTRIQYVSSEPLTVHGLRVAFSSPRLPSKEVSNIRSSVRFIEKLYKEGMFRRSASYRRAYNRCMGRVNKLKRVGHRQHADLIRRLREVHPECSRNDLIRAYDRTLRLEREHPLKSDTFGYYKRYFVLMDRLNLVQRRFPRIAEGLRRRLREIKPNFE